MSSEAEPFLADIETDHDVELGSLNHNDNAYPEREGVPRKISHLGTGHLSDSARPPPTDRGRSGLLSAATNFLSRSWKRRRYSKNQSSIRGRHDGAGRAGRKCLRFIAVPLMFFGVVQITSLILNLAVIFFPNKLDGGLISWQSAEPPQSPTHWPTDATADIIPVHCHSHNDYWRKIPVKSGIQAGCIGIEADVWLRKGDLFVGHNPASLTKERTFTSLYIHPLVDMLAKQNPVTEFHPSVDSPPFGVFDTDTEQSLVLLIDFKTDGHDLWPVVASQLEPLRRANYLTSFEGGKLTSRAVTVVVTGNAPFDRVIANTTYRDIFFDAPLQQVVSLGSNPPAALPFTYDPAQELAFLESLPSQTNSQDVESAREQIQSYSPSNPSIYSPFNSYYASTSLKDTIGIPMPYLTAIQRQRLSDQIAGAHSLGLQVRYWETPAWPISWRNYIWRELVKMGIDFLNVDDLESAAKGDWRSVGGFGKWIWGTGQW